MDKFGGSYFVLFKSVDINLRMSVPNGTNTLHTGFNQIILVAIIRLKFSCSRFVCWWTMV